VEEIQVRARFYNEAFPARPALGYSNGWVTGTWAIGACYKNPNKLYGAYPYGYLDRVHSMFPDARKILHVFSGGLTEEQAMSQVGWVRKGNHSIYSSSEEPFKGLFPLADVGMQLVDMHGPEDGRYPTWQGDVTAMPEEWAGRFDLVLADPPYSAADAVKYDCPPPNRAKVMRELHRVTANGGNLVWLDQVWPMHRKDMWKTWGHIGLVRSTNHRMRLVSMFQKVS
jgi:hypothetical protein